jgi:predicted metal-dependent peptidase
MEEYWQAGMRDTHRPHGDCRVGGAGIGDLLDARSDRATAMRWQGTRWGRGAPSSALELERMKRAIAKHLRGERGGDDDPLARTQRRIAKELERVVRAGDGAAWIEWRRVLREAFPRRRAVRPDYLRPNRRFPERVGEVPGRTRRPPRPRLLVGVDTSGSMTGATLDRVADEIRRLARHAQLTIIECDAIVHRVYPLAGAPTAFVGGGDTDFAPIFDETRGTRDVEGLVLFTDGKGQMPDGPPTLPLLWVLTHDDPFLADWGSIVRMAPR